MEKIKFKGNDTVFNATIVRIKAGVCKLTLEKKISDTTLLSGFQILNEHNGSVVGDFSDYSTIYKESESDYSYYLSNGEVHVEPVVSTEDTIVEEIVYTEEELASMLEIAKESKIQEMSKICENTIFLGVDVNEKHFSYTLQDQANLSYAISVAKETGMGFHYHADGEPYSLYTLAELNEIQSAEQLNVKKNQVYFNQLKLYIQSITDVNDLDTVKNITYGDQLMGEYLECYNIIMEESSEILATFLV